MGTQPVLIVAGSVLIVAGTGCVDRALHKRSRTMSSTGHSSNNMYLSLSPRFTTYQDWELGQLLHLSQPHILECENRNMIVTLRFILKMT